ncbi:MAG TPA: alternative ribosome rescue aminoacyl-tRNA hydrolase ArfB [Pirellulales bacterium]|jgi:ribosome-associated protein
MLTVNARIRIPESEFEWSFARSSGPGGQNVNKVNSKAVLRWKPSQSVGVPAEVLDRFVTRFATRLTNEGDLLLSSQRFRDQGRNVSDVLEKLRAMLAAVAQRPRQRRATRPTKAAVARRIETKQAQGKKKRLRRAVERE